MGYVKPWANRPQSLACVLLAFFAVFMVFFWSCAAPRKKPPTLPGHPAPYKIGRTWYQPMKHAGGFRQKGTASWYGSNFHGRKTSNGETYNMHAMTAAHKTLPMGTYVKVRNLKNNKTVVVRVNDRGPFIRGRIIDLSYGAAKKIGLVGPGTAPVEIVALGMAKKGTGEKRGRRSYVPVNYYVGDFTIQVGSFKEKENALILKNRLAKIYDNVHIVQYDSDRGVFFRVRVARCTTLDEARRYEKKLETQGFPDAIVVAR